VQPKFVRHEDSSNSDNVQPKLVHNSHDDSNLMQIDQVHVDDSSELVRYFEKLVRDEVSACNSAPDLSDSNLMHPVQF